MYQVKDLSNAYAIRVIAETETLPEAIRAISGKIYFLEEDDDHPDHYDIITWQGGQFTIEPKKVKSNA
jgi:hypothetical protein